MNVRETLGQSASTRRGVVERITLGAAAVFAFSYSVLTLRGVWLSLIESSRAPDMPGIFPILAGASAAIGFVLGREALAPRSNPPPLRRLVARAFGYGWICGVASTILITIVTLLPGSFRFDLGTVLLSMFNYLIVSLILSIPGLLALSLSRQRRKTP